MQKWAYRFLTKNSLALRRVTRSVDQTNEVLPARKAAFFEQAANIKQTEPGVVFLNMDQTAIQYEMCPTKAIDNLGSTSMQVAVHESTTSRLTLALTIGSDGPKGMPFAIYKGTSNGRIIREFTAVTNQYPQTIAYSV